MALRDVFFFSSRRRHTRYWRDWSSDVCSSDLGVRIESLALGAGGALMLTGSPLRGDRHVCLWELPSARPVARLSIDGGAGTVFAPGGRRFVRSEERRVGKECRSRGSP